MLKTFYYQFEDPHFIRSIQVNTKECPTIRDLTKKIAGFFNLSYYHLIVENQPNEKQLEKITEKFIFVINFPNRRTDITFFFPKNKTINIQNGYRLNYNQIIHSFQENHFYYSDECARNYLQFMIFDKELPHIEFPLIAIPSGICINVKLQCEQVILTYNENYFTFAENEMASEAFKLIKEVYNGCHLVSIQTNESKINERDSLRRFVTYKVGVYYKIVFKNIENWSEETLLLDFLSTVSDAQKQLFVRLGNNEISNASKITIYNGNMQIINDNNILLKNIQDFSNFFYYEIKKKSPEKVTPKKANFELDPKFSYTPNRKTKTSYIDYSKTPELKIRSDYNHDIAFYSKTPEKLPNSFYNSTFSDASEKRFDSDLNKKKSNKKSNLNSNKKSSTKPKSSTDNTNSSMNFKTNSNANSETKLNNKTTNSNTSQNKITTKLNTKTPNKSFNDSKSNIANKPSTSSKISVNETKFNSSQKSSTNSKNQSNSKSNKKAPLNSTDKFYQQSNTTESIKSKRQESKPKDEFDDDYDEYFENSSSRNNQTKDTTLQDIDDFQQSLELDELKKLLNEEEEEEEFHEKNKDVNSNGQEENDEIEEEEFKENYNSEIIDQKDNNANNEEEDILNQNTEDQNKIDDLSNDDAFFVEANDSDISNSNQDEKNALDIFEEEEE